MRPPRAERGGFTPVAAAVVFVLASVALGGATLGRMVVVRGEVQRAVDTTALAALKLINARGFPFDTTLRAAAEAVGNKNSSLPLRYEWTVTDTDRELSFRVRARVDMPVPKLVMEAGAVTIVASATGSVPQRRFDTATRRLPKLVLVLDFSGSMDARIRGGGGKRAIQVLKDNVRSLLDADFPIRYGAVLYSNSAFASVPVGDAAPASIKRLLDRYGAGGGTCTSCGLYQANNLLATAGEDTGRHVFLVSDGQPNVGGGEGGARAAAGTLWRLNASQRTLHIDWSTGRDRRLADFMKSVSGSPVFHPDPTYYYRADSADALRKIFQRFVAEILCSVGPISPAPEVATLKVFLRTPGGEERSVPPEEDLASSSIEAYRYDTPSQTVRLTDKACHAILDDQHQVVVRSGEPALTE
jgi:Mg-chelatase subunit ChlD